VHIHDYYYDAKPFLPWRLRMAARRIYVRGIRANCGGYWPIDPAAGAPPADWPGWPEGKRFAVVLTHDVEGIEGLGKCARLMDLERSLGFRSSFNFIPEGDYRVEERLRHQLVDSGFEVGVHDLNHDGKLYRTREGFREKAGIINRYLQEWGAVGFRSGFMHHNLEWLHDLNVSYDASTFDTDPFEPQPDGVGTIFPFWVPSPAAPGRLHNDSPADGPRRGEAASGVLRSAGYVELPYTLPQDSTLFLLFKEKSIEIWKRKLDWIAERGGMALLGVHPDYISFDGDLRGGRQFPARFYTELLQYIKSKYGGCCWNALPKEIATFVRHGKV
jgi:hypothetical protein